ncbi:Uncharacterized protein TCM_044080 [Theobroma cacao]|uniref:Uncharacterized protein n=1 Tax=Theobroma cacao TaxID=3641 RepID=A0A061FWN7_THECC|nr:Uncharacterized protein TCM_044080 [Theobroma cacao]
MRHPFWAHSKVLLCLGPHHLTYSFPSCLRATRQALQDLLAKFRTPDLLLSPEGNAFNHFSVNSFISISSKTLKLQLTKHRIKFNDFRSTCKFNFTSVSFYSCVLDMKCF